MRTLSLAFVCLALVACNSPTTFDPCTGSSACLGLVVDNVSPATTLVTATVSNGDKSKEYTATVNPATERPLGFKIMIADSGFTGSVTIDVISKSGDTMMASGTTTVNVTPGHSARVELTLTSMNVPPDMAGGNKPPDMTDSPDLTPPSCPGMTGKVQCVSTDMTLYAYCDSPAGVYVEGYGCFISCNNSLWDGKYCHNI